MKTSSKLGFLTCAAASAMALSTPAAAAGFIALEGSDATTYHHDTQYSTQLFKYLQGGSAKQILVYNPSGTFNIDGSTGKTNAYATSLAGLTLSDYSALYIQTPGTCCSANNTVLNGYGAAVNAFISSGGNLSIGDYTGGTFDGVVPGGAAPFGTIGGVSGNGASGPSCTDGETVTGLGIAKGFTQPPVLGCWAHQGYQTSYWSKFGYQNLIASSTEYTYGDGSHDGSSFLALGGTLGGGVPEPTTWALMLSGIGFIGAAARRRAKATVTYA